MSKPINALKHSLYIFSSSFILGTGYSVLCNGDESYEVLKNLIYTPHHEFKLNSEIKFKEGSLTQRYDHETLMNYLKQCVWSVVGLTFYPFRKEFFKAQYVDETKLNTLKNQRSLITNLNETLINYQNNFSTAKQKHNLTNYEEQTEIFRKNLDKTLKWKNQLKGKDDLSDEDKIILEKPTVVSLSKDDFKIISVKGSEKEKKNLYNLLKDNKNSELNRTVAWSDLTNKERVQDELAYQRNIEKLDKEGKKNGDGAIQSLLHAISLQKDKKENVDK